MKQTRAPVFIEAVVGPDIDAIGIEQIGMPAQGALLHGKLEVRRRHEAQAGSELTVAGTAADDGELRLHVHGKPGQGQPGDVVVEVGKIAL